MTTTSFGPSVIRSNCNCWMLTLLRAPRCIRCNATRMPVLPLYNVRLNVGSVVYHDRDRVREDDGRGAGRPSSPSPSPSPSPSQSSSGTDGTSNKTNSSSDSNATTAASAAAAAVEKEEKVPSRSSTTGKRNKRFHSLFHEIPKEESLIGGRRGRKPPLATKNPSVTSRCSSLLRVLMCALLMWFSTFLCFFISPRFFVLFVLVPFNAWLHANCRRSDAYDLKYACTHATATHPCMCVPDAAYVCALQRGVLVQGTYSGVFIKELHTRCNTCASNPTWIWLAGSRQGAQSSVSQLL